ncbi:CBS domain-containing protein [Noviherbaspirillum sp. CPCC 100848]|uniref:CBS domain-containing protein n=1 Tax=Noviherbaspirillum album TaxID=3080276 RepID=A0ABU6J4F6_9BURK|nr:CBS domain-containing protein [Noviherbaspirillum sp. CPCC 100848]MEC4718094.1 CBS domain-containing protein [Noviherbaspirillum sp. CPCC 100848]
MKAQDVMTMQPICVTDNATLEDAIALMLRHKISGLPVLNDAGRVTGMLTEGDLLRRTETQTERKRPRWLEFLIGPGKLAKEFVHAHGRHVKEVMSTQVIAAAPDTTLDEVVRLMEKHRIKRVPVIRENQLVGIVSRANLVQALGAVIHEIPAAKSSDNDIRTQLLATLEKTTWAPTGMLDIIVRNGVVHINGVVTNAEEINALTVAAENTPGVKEVRNDVAWCDPMSGLVIENEPPAVQARDSLQRQV